MYRPDICGSKSHLLCDSQSAQFPPRSSSPRSSNMRPSRDMIRTVLRLVLHFCLGCHSLALDAFQVKQGLSSILLPQASIILRNDVNWANETVQRFDAWSAPTYIVSVKPAIEEDVRLVVREITLPDQSAEKYSKTNRLHIQKTTRYRSL